MNKAEIWAELESRNIVTATLGFSGGNDEGGVECVTVEYKDGTVVDLNWNDDLGDLLQGPIFDKYYSFAGEFYVSGELVYDVESKTIEMTGDERNYVSDGFHESY